MADIKISALPGASTLDGTETIPLVQGGTTKKATVSSVWTMVNPSYTGTLTGGTGVVNLGSGQFVKDASGNLGLGVTPSGNFTLQAKSSFTDGFKGFSLGGFRGGASGSGYPWVGYNIRPTSTSNAYIYDVNDVVSAIKFADGISFYVAPSGTAGNAISFTQAMTLDASGNLGVGVTPSALFRLDINGNTRISSAGAEGFEVQPGAMTYVTAYNRSTAAYTPMAVIGEYISFGTGLGAERARIDASGNLLVGATSGNTHTLQKSGSNEYAVKIVNTTATNSYGVLINLSGVTGGAGQYFLQGIDDATRFQILGNGNIQNLNNSYGAISDLKLKENITDVSPKLSKLMQVRIVNYNLKADPDKTKLIGVVAQELEKVSPGLIEETADFEDVKKTREVTKSVPVTEQVTVQREQKTVEVVDGKAVVTVTLVDEQTAVPVVDQYPLFDADCQPVLEVDTPEVPEVLDEDGNVTQPAVPATYRQAMHSVPRMQDVTETEEYTERVPLGTTTKSVKYSVFVPMLVKAVQEQQAQIEALSARLAALEAK